MIMRPLRPYARLHGVVRAHDIRVDAFRSSWAVCLPGGDGLLGLRSATLTCLTTRCHHDDGDFMPSRNTFRPIIPRSGPLSADAEREERKQKKFLLRTEFRPCTSKKRGGNFD